MRLTILGLLMYSSTLLAQNQQVAKAKFSSFRSQLAYSLDQTVLGISENNQLGLYSPQTLELTRKLEGHSGTITAILFCSDNQHMISAGLDKKLLYWDYLSGSIKGQFPSNQPILGAALLEESKVVFTSRSNITGYDFSTSKQLFSIPVGSELNSISIAKDGKIIAVATPKGDITLFNAEGQLIRSFNAGNKNLSALEISSSGKMIAAGFQDGKIILLDDKGTMVTSFVDFKKWIKCIEFSPDSKYFAAGDDWGNCIVFSMDKMTIAEKVKVREVPILAVAFSLDGQSLTLVASETEVSSWDIKRLGIASVFKLKDQADRTPPQIFISSPPNIHDDRVRIYTDVVEIKGTLIDDSGIRGLRVNGIDVPIKENSNFVIIQPLAMGDNQFVIEAKDINDHIAIKRFTIQRKNPAGENYNPDIARNFLFVVGINDYAHWPKLNNAVKDANDIANLLIKQYGFELEHYTMLRNDQATRSNIYKVMRSLIEQVTPQDNLLIYFSGHGHFDGLMNEGYWIPVEAEVNNSGDYLSNSDILKLIGNIDSHHTFLIADACFSGSLFSESKKGYSENVEQYKSRWGLTSGRLDFVSDGAIGQHSPFAAATIDFLNNNQKDKFAISELVQDVKMKVAETSKQTPMGNPLKALGDEGGEMILYRKKN